MKRVENKLLIFLIVFFPFLSMANENGKKIYQNRCSSCHHSDRIGLSGPPLLLETLEKLPDEKMRKIISKGLPNTLMPAYPDLSSDDISGIIKYLRTPKTLPWGKKEILNSLEKNRKMESPKPFKDVLNLTAVVERGLSKIWLMEGDEVLDKFDFSDVHGGIKYSRDYKRFFVPARNGMIGKYNINKGFDSKIRACISLRNITVSNDNKYLIVSCLYPQQMVVLNQEDLSVKKNNKTRRESQRHLYTQQ